MTQRKKLLAFGLSAVVVCIVGVTWNSFAQENDHSDAIARRDFMRAKMMYSSNILQGLTSHDFKTIEESADEISGLTRAEEWLAVKDEDYARMSNELRISADRLKKAAKEENIDGATLRFVDMTVKCIDCHEHIRELSF